MIYVTSVVQKKKQQTSRTKEERSGSVNPEVKNATAAEVPGASVLSSQVLLCRIPPNKRKNKEKIDSGNVSSIRTVLFSFIFCFFTISNNLHA